MELSISDDQRLLMDTTRRFLAENAPPSQLRAWRAEPAGCGPEFWPQGAELGWTSLLVPADAGGGSVSGKGVADLALIAHEFGRNAAPGPIIAANVVAAALGSRGTAAQQDHELAQILAGETVSWCHEEPGPQGIFAAATSVLESSGDGYRLTGAKAPAEHGAQAACFLVSARSDGGITQVLVPRDAPGVTVAPLEGIDLNRRFAEVRFDRTPVAPEAVVGEAGGAAAAVERQIQLALVIQVHEMVGAMERAFEMTLEWSLDRYSFGRPLASYQEIKHRFADMKSWLEASHALADAAARAVQTNAGDAGELASAAKSYIAQHGTELGQDCVQIHGGLGLTFEHDIHLFLRRIALGAATLGTARHHRLRLADLLQADQTEAR